MVVVVRIVVWVMIVRVSCIRVLGLVGVLYIGALEVNCVGVVGILVLGGVFVVQVAEGVELMVGCVVRLILWCVNGRAYFLCCFSLKSVEINKLNVGRYLFGMVIWEVYFVLLDRGFSGRTLGMNRCSGFSWYGGADADVVEMVCSVIMDVGMGGVGNKGRGVVSSGGNVSVVEVGADSEGLGGGIAAGSPMGFLESFRKTSHILHSHSILAMSSCRLVCNEEVVKAIEALIDRCVGRSVGGSQGLNGLWSGSLQWGWL